MKRFYSCIMVALSLALFCGCATIVPVTNNIIESVGGESQLKNFQYYVSKNVLLNRSEQQSDGGLDDKGMAHLVNVTNKNQILIKATTPGVVVNYRYNSSSSHNYLFAAFEEDDSKYLMFVTVGNRNDSPYYLQTANNSAVFYGDVFYNYSSPSSKVSSKVERLLPKKWRKENSNGLPCLMIKLNKKYIVNEESRTAKGRKIKK